MFNKACENAFTLSVPEEAHDERLDVFLARAIAELTESGGFDGQLSRERIKKLLQDGHALINGTIQTKVATRLRQGDTIVLTLPDCRPIPLEAEAIPLSVVYEDDALAVINKPAGMLTHPTGRERTGTLVNALLHHCAGQLSGINGYIRPGIVHRLDRDTSGLLVTAKHDKAHHGLAEQLRARTMHRTYHAIIQGVMPKPQGSISAPIGRHAKQRDKMTVDPAHGREATTHWQQLESIHDRFSLLELNLETGRTHQIRVHLAHLGHPVLGDALYGSGLEKQLRLPRSGQLLQAVALAFTHPVTGEPMRFEITHEPAMKQTLALLRTR